MGKGNSEQKESILLKMARLLDEGQKEILLDCVNLAHKAENSARKSMGFYPTPQKGTSSVKAQEYSCTNMLQRSKS